MAKESQNSSIDSKKESIEEGFQDLKEGDITEEWEFDGLPEIKILTDKERLAEIARLFGRYFVRCHLPVSPRHPGAQYDPKEDGIAHRELVQDNVHVTYSMPQTEKGVVASFWADMYEISDDKHIPDRKVRERVHIDLPRILAAILKFSDVYYPVKYSEEL